VLNGRPMIRRLSLKREVIGELTAADLAIVNAAAPRTIACTGQTEYSCLDYISCNELACVIRDTADATARLVATVQC
jgi:hypothetical protein